LRYILRAASLGDKDCSRRLSRGEGAMHARLGKTAGKWDERFNALQLAPQKGVPAV